MLIRPADPADALAVAGVHVRSWQAGYRGLLPDAYLAGLDPAERAARYTFGDDSPEPPHTQLATDGTEVLGFVTTGPSRDSGDRSAGEVYALYVDPAAWGGGVGRALMTAGRRRLVDLGATSATLWVLAGNERAQRFYRADGWRSDGVERCDELFGISVDEVRYSTVL